VSSGPDTAEYHPGVATWRASGFRIPG